MYEKLCRLLCLHTRTTQIVFFSTLFFILSITFVFAVYWYEPQAMPLPPEILQFQPAALAARFYDEFGRHEGERHFRELREMAGAGNGLLQDYHFLRGQRKASRTLTGEEILERFRGLKQEWSQSGLPLLSARDPYIRAAAQDLEEALELATGGLAGPVPFINRNVVRARGIFHDLSAVLLANGEKSSRYYGQTRLGRLVEQGLPD